MDWEWINTTSSGLLMVVLSAVVIYAVLLLCTRVAGLRSFSKMSGFDFAITIATGSLFAATILTPDPPLLQGVVGLIMLFVLQFTVSKLRRRLPVISKLVDNQPLLLMAGSELIQENLERARMTREDLMSHMRMAGVTHSDQVLAVIMETTGDVSVLKVTEKGFGSDLDLFLGVRDAHRLEGVGDR